MIVKCPSCLARFEDQFRSTVCPHLAFPANDGLDNFSVHEDAYYEPPPYFPRAPLYVRHNGLSWFARDEGGGVVKLYVIGFQNQHTLTMTREEYNSKVASGEIEDDPGPLRPAS